MTPSQPHQKRKTLRLPDYDYSQAGAYFITLVTQKRLPIFGNVTNGSLHLSKFGNVARDMLLALPTFHSNLLLDEFCIMPNHIHMILLLNDPEFDNSSSVQPKTIQEIVRGYKSFSARKINGIRNTTGSPVWQRGFYEEIIESEKVLEKVRRYIHENPIRSEINA